MNHLVGKDGDGKPFMLLVLEPGNLHKLREGKPIRLRVEDMFPDGIPKTLRLDILFSETPIADSREIAKMSDVVFDERTPANQQRRPHCAECRSTIEQLGVWRGDSPVALVFCPCCGCVLGTLPRAAFAELPGEKP